MRVLIGAEAAESAKEISGWVQDLGFDALTEEWMQVVPSNVSAVWALDPLLAAGESERFQEQTARKAERALQELSGGSAVRVRIGNPIMELLNHADETSADLIAIRGSNKNVVSAFLLGSVARGLVEGASQSVLLTRGSAPQGPLRVVVATDHSEYMDSALEKLASWAPHGIGRLTVLHVLPPVYKSEMDQLAQEIAHEAYGRPITTPEEVTATAAKALGQKLGLSVDTIDSQVASGPVPQTIVDIVDEADADLLIIGAKGHSFLERLTLGSVSFRTVTTCPKSVLVLRV